MLRWIVRIAIETGMRSSEITTLRPSQVDLSRRVVRLLETKNTLPRTVPLSTEATALFQQALAHPIRPIGIDLIFFGEPGKDGQRRPDSFNKVRLDIKRSAGFADFRFHDLWLEAVSRVVVLLSMVSGIPIPRPLGRGSLFFSGWPQRPCPGCRHVV